MKNWLTQAIGLCAAVMLFSSCEKDEVKVTATPGAAPTTIAATATSVDLQKANAAVTAVTYSWKPVGDFAWSSTDGSFKPPVSYTIQFAKKGTNFAQVKEEDAGTSGSKAYTIGQINAIFTGLGLPFGVPAQLDVRLKSSYAPNVDPVTTSVVNLAGTPYESRELPALAWGLIGPAGLGWDADMLMTYNFDTKSWSLTADLKADEYKFRANKAWASNLGDAGAAGTLKHDGANLKIAAAGNYTIVLTFKEGATTPANTGTYTITKN